jgi:hypothetical protein
LSWRSRRKLSRCRNFGPKAAAIGSVAFVPGVVPGAREAVDVSGVLDGLRCDGRLCQMADVADVAGALRDDPGLCRMADVVGYADSRSPSWCAGPRRSVLADAATSPPPPVWRCGPWRAGCSSSTPKSRPSTRSWSRWLPPLRPSSSPRSVSAPTRRRLARRRRTEHKPSPQRTLLRPALRRRPPRRVIRQAAPTPTQPRRGPPSQLGAVADRDQPALPRPDHPALPPAPSHPKPRPRPKPSAASSATSPASPTTGSHNNHWLDTT